MSEKNNNKAGGERKDAECEDCAPLAPVYIATFSDMAILLMAFFVLLLASAVVNPKLYDEPSEASQVTGVQTQVRAFQQATAENMVVNQFRSAPVSPTVFDIVEEERTDVEQSEEEVQTDSDPGKAKNNAVEIVEQRFAREIARGEVEIREENSKIVVEVAETFGQGDDEIKDQVKLAGEVDANLLELYLEVATAKSETGASIEVRSGSPQTDNFDESAEADDTPIIYRNLILALEEEIESGLLEVKRDGTDVIINLPSANGFSSGSATLRPSFLALLDSIGDALIPVQRVARIEGHTDAVPLAFGGRFKNNWELSSARAASVADYLLDQQYRRGGEVYIVGYGDAKPVASNDTSAGRGLNRRIEIVLPRGYSAIGQSTY